MRALPEQNATGDNQQQRPHITHPHPMQPLDIEIAKEEEENIYQMFRDCVEEEKLWAEYLFKDGSIIGLNDKLLAKYVEWTANRRLKSIGLKAIFDTPITNNPLPWTEHWLSSKGMQVAPQETEVESYLIGSIKQDVKANTFAGFQL